VVLTTAKAWELRDGDVVIIKLQHYTLTDDPKPGPPGWTRLTTRDRAGLVTIHLIEGTDDVNVVRARDYSQRRENARRMDNQRRRAR
jgi:hypothetical protein